MSEWADIDHAPRDGRLLLVKLTIDPGFALVKWNKVGWWDAAKNQNWAMDPPCFVGWREPEPRSVPVAGTEQTPADRLHDAMIEDILATPIEELEAEEEARSFPSNSTITDEDREWIEARADELFRESERRRGGVRPQTIRPDDFRDYFVVDATAERLGLRSVPDGGPREGR